MSKVTLKSTKQEIMDEVVKLQEQLKEARASKVTVSDVKTTKEKEEKVKKAQEIIDMNILNPEIIKQFNDVKFAIEEAKKDLAEIQEVTDAIIDAEAVIMAKNNIIADKEKQEVEKIEQLKKETEVIINDKTKKVSDLEQEYADKKTTLEKERKREAEEFDYTLKRSRRLDNDKWEEEKAARLKEITDREDALSKREEEMTKKETEFKEFKEKVEGIKDLVKQAKEDGQAEAKKSFDKEKAIEINSIKKNAEWEIKLAKMEQERNLEDLMRAQEQIESLQQKLEAAYNSMNALATTTVQSTGGVKVLDVGRNSEPQKR
ncbi:hypothetical protein AN639_07695 [Candidatus Epulonipiscium fishelsonii]|uniref:Uncharacterized protein n=1 Tax=Candidatus Epulonipiscium fishelsonii TaxID=77094 RepID=A0ACC8XBG2_9FIRM|nr:hypothetical protein AN639_07695 [Epulopiscium sp. SCG-B05WGA-EpuloA1]ONI39786.1 hypothetical protein AN396_06945 [Epulopiscium sp. SCG-B11WGA-EpuloA1]